jgi:hypothetical protein
MLFDWHHLKNRKTHYLGHLIFALQIVIRLILVSIVLLGHSIVPWIRIPKYFRIISLSNYLYDCDYKMRTGRFP